MKVLDYIIKKHKIDMNDIKEKCKRINSIMSEIKIGDKFYVSDCWGDAFEQEVLEIIDKYTGDVKVIERGINCTQVTNVENLKTRDEMNEYLKSAFGTGLK